MYEIWPFIRKHVPDSRFHIIGSYPSQRVLQLHNEREGLLVHGRAGSAQEVVQKAKVLLAPLRFGAGLKGKLLDAMRWGTPTVTTEIGAEGMAWKGLRSEEHTSELQSRGHLVCRLLLEKKKKRKDQLSSST